MRFFKVCFAAMAICIAWISPFGLLELCKCFNKSHGFGWITSGFASVVIYPLWVVTSVDKLMRFAVIMVAAPIEAIYHKARHGTKIEEITNVYTDRIIKAFDFEGYDTLNEAKEALSRL